MRVLMVEPSGRGGMYAYTDALCRGLAACGVPVTVLTSPFWPEEAQPFSVNRSLRPLVALEGGSSRLRWAIDRLSVTWGQSRMRNRLARSGAFDVVHLQMGAPVVDQFLLRRLARRIPVVLTVHDVKPHMDRFVSKRQFLRRYFQVPHRLVVHYRDGQRQMIEDWGCSADRVAVIPHGVMPTRGACSGSEARDRLGIPQDRRVLLFFGGIRPNKGLDVLLKAMPAIRAQHAGVLLVIAGAIPRDTCFDPFTRTVEQLGLTEAVRSFVRFIPDEDVDAFFAASDVVVLPYLHFEAQSGVLLRAYAHHKPVVVTDVGAMGELVRDDQVGEVVPPNDVDALAAAVARVLSARQAYEGRYGAEIERKYSWTTIAESTLRCYEETIGAWTAAP